MSLNVVVIQGNLTRDPEIRFPQGGGDAVANCGVAINDRWTGRDGQKQERTTFVDFECWGKTAEFLNEYFRRGKEILIQGELKLDEWEDRDSGQKRQKLKVKALKLSFCGPPTDGGGGGGGGGRQEQRGDQGGRGEQRQAPPAGDQGGNRRPPQDEVNFDDIPF